MQTLYGMADLFIIGCFNGVESTTAVSIGSQVIHMLTVIIIGMAMGPTVLIGKSVGAGRKDLTSKAVGNTISLFIIIYAVLTAVLLFAVKPIVNIMSTPAEAASGTISYLTICFAGIPFIAAFNVISAVFRGMGNSKTPMYFVAVACAANIVLDCVFIGICGMGASGAALGTILSQAISVAISLFVISKKDFGISVSKASIRPQKSVMSELIKVGVPVALQDGFIQISFLAITLFANLRGLADSAAVGIVKKIIGIMFLVPSAMLSTVSALSARYIGEKNYPGARLVLRYALTITVCFGAVSSAAMMLAAESAVGLFTGDDTVIILGGQYMRGYVWDCLLAGIHFCFSGYFCAMGRSEISFAHNCASILIARLPLAYLASVYFTDTLSPMGLASTIGSCLSVIICVLAYKRISFTKKKTL